MDLFEAEEKVESYLRALESRFGTKLSIMKESTREEAFGWVYFYNSREFVETGDFHWALGGNAPVIVDKETGEIHEAGTTFPIEVYIDYFRKNRTMEGV